MRKIRSFFGFVLYLLLGSWTPHYLFGYTFKISKFIRMISAKLLFDKCGKNVDIGRKVKLNSKIELGDNSGIGDYNYFSGKVIIGRNVLIGPNVMFLASNHNFDRKDVPINKQGENSKGIIIEDDVWIGARAVILDGVKLSKGTVVGAGSIVTKSTETNSIIGGNPAKLIRKR